MGQFHHNIHQLIFLLISIFFLAFSSSSRPVSESPAFPPSYGGADAPSPSSSSYSLDYNPETQVDFPEASVPEEITTTESPDGENPIAEESDLMAAVPKGLIGTGSAILTGNIEVKKVCQSTDYPSLCMNTINPLLIGTKHQVNLDTVLEVSIQATNDLTKSAKLMATKLATAPGTDSQLATVFNSCKDSYDDALYNFESAMNAYVTKDVGTMNTMLSAVITDVGDCEDGLKSLNVDCPLAEFGQKLTNMTSNCLAIVSLIHQ